MPFPMSGGTLGGNGGPGKIISPVSGSAGLHDSPLSTRSPYSAITTKSKIFVPLFLCDPVG